MGIEWFRDLSITIMGFVTAAVLIFTVVLVYRLYRKITTTLVLVQTLMKSVNDAVNTMEEIIKNTSQNIDDTITEVKDSIKLASKGISDSIIFQVQEGIKPLLSIMAVIQGISEGFKGISKMFKRGSNEGGNSNESGKR